MKRLMCAAMAGITALTSIVMTVPAAAEEKTNRYGDFEYQINGSEVTIINMSAMTVVYIFRIILMVGK